MAWLGISTGHSSIFQLFITFSSCVCACLNSHEKLLLAKSFHNRHDTRVLTTATTVVSFLFLSQTPEYFLGFSFRFILQSCMRNSLRFDFLSFTRDVIFPLNCFGQIFLFFFFSANKTFAAYSLSLSLTFDCSKSDFCCEYWHFSV